MNKKIIILLIGIFLLLGCENSMATPSSKVESFFNKYQKLDKNVLLDLDNVIKKDKSMNKEQKEIYKDLLEKQYQNLSYKIKNEEVNNNSAIVETEIEVLDYNNSIIKSQKYYEKHKNEIDNYIDYKLKKMQEVDEKIKYELIFFLRKEKGNWIIEELNEEEYKKIHGLY